MKSVFSFYVVSWEKNLKQWWLFRPANSILYNFRDNFQILGMGNQSSTMGYHKPPGDLTTTIIKIITITLTPGLVTPAHHRPNHLHPNYHHPSHHPLPHQAGMELSDGFPCKGMEIWPRQLEFHARHGNLSSAWNLHQGLDGNPTKCFKIPGWKSNLAIQRYTMITLKNWCPTWKWTWIAVILWKWKWIAIILNH